MLTRFCQKLMSIPGAATLGHGGAAPRGGRRRAVALRLATLLLCLGVVVSSVDLDRAILELGSISGPTLLLAVALHVAIIVILSYRWRLIARAAGASLTFPAAARLTFVSTLANLFLPTSVAGDVGRIWLVQRHGLDLYRGILVGASDRVVGVVTLGVLALAGILAAPGLIPDPIHAMLWASLAAFVVAVTIGVALARRARARGQRGALIDLLRRGPMLGSVALSLAGHAIAVVIAVVIVRDMTDSLSFSEALALFPAVLLASSIPISVGGWGVRELAAIAVFPLAGMTAGTAVAMALAFGFTEAMAAGLGTFATTTAGWGERP